MFDSNPERDEIATQRTRRAFLAGSAVTAAGLAGLWIFRTPTVEAGAVVHGEPGQVTIVEFSNDGKQTGKGKVAKVVKTDAEWLQQLGKNSYQIARKADTEMPYSGGEVYKEHGDGVYRCICCDTALFNAKTKFESGTGWPSFWAPIAKENIIERSDASIGMLRTEVVCRLCEGHLGHVFDDGPQPTGMRYCMNAASMKFLKA
jgi:peptide-methionine (R)-S-oxide reductase